MYGEDAGLVRHIVGIEGESRSLDGMFVMRGISLGGLRRRHRKMFAGNTNQGRKQDYR